MTANGLNFVWRCILSATSAPSGGVKSKSNRNQHNVWENKQVTIGIPGWVKYTWVPNETETKAAWQLYVELATRIASQPFDPKRGSLRAAFDSLYVVFSQTRTILRIAGPDVARSPKSFGPLAIRFLTKELAPFLLEWNEPLRVHEKTRQKNTPVIEHERAWKKHKAFCKELQDLQEKTDAYRTGLEKIAGVYQDANEGVI